MSEFRYTLPNKDYPHKKGDCPNCGREGKGRFSLYIDKLTGEPVHPTVGICDRINSCKYDYPYDDYFRDNGIPFEYFIGGITFDKETPHTPRKEEIPKPQLPPSYIDTKVFKGSLKGYNKNQFVQGLYRVYGVEVVNRVIERYHVGTCNHWGGATVFWQVDSTGEARTGSVMQYDENISRVKVKDKDTGKTKALITWVHSLLGSKQPDFKPTYCFFGEHLLVDTTKPVVIVESEKTAIIASLYFPQYVWLACSGCHGLSDEKCKVLKGRNVTLYPDVKQFEYWSKQAKKLKPICGTVKVSKLIEELATEEERKAGCDVADYLLKLPLPNSTKQAPVIETSVPEEETEYQPAYVGNDGTLYIPTPPDRRTTYTVWESVDAYNQRKGTISFIPMQNMDTSGMKQVSINLKTLTI
jgi:hypothetical protein